MNKQKQTLPVFNSLRSHTSIFLIFLLWLAHGYKNLSGVIWKNSGASRWVIEQGEKIPIMKLRHINPGSIGWKDKNSPIEFLLIQMGKNKIVFEAKDKNIKLSYSVTPMQKMDITLEEKNKKDERLKTGFIFCI